MMKKLATRIRHCLPLCLLIIAIAVAFYFRLDQYLNFSVLKAHHELLQAWTAGHYLWMVLAFISLYILIVTLSIPGAAFLTVVGGFLFGIIGGTFYVVISASIGATMLFLIVRFALMDWFSKKTIMWVAQLRHGFQAHAFQYLLVLRLVPLFPFWIVNIVPALLNVRSRTFILATLLGIIPGSFVYAAMGNSLGQILDAGQTPNMSIIFEAKILWPLIGLAFLVFIPRIYKRIKRGG